MYKQGDIIIVKYPFSDAPEKSKLRPAIVVSNKASNKLDHDLLICPITSTIRESAFSYPLKKDDTLKPLPKENEIRCNKIITIRDKKIEQKFTELKTKQLKKVITLVKSCF